MASVHLAIAVMLVHQALTSPVLWIELGKRLRYRKPMGVQTREWRHVRSPGFVDEQSRFRTRVPGLAIPLATHRILVLKLRDGTELRVKVTPEQEGRIRGIAAWGFAAQPGTYSDGSTSGPMPPKLMDG